MVKCLSGSLSDTGAARDAPAPLRERPPRPIGLVIARECENIWLIVKSTGCDDGDSLNTTARDRSCLKSWVVSPSWASGSVAPVRKSSDTILPYREGISLSTAPHERLEVSSEHSFTQHYPAQIRGAGITPWMTGKIAPRERIAPQTSGARATDEVFGTVDALFRARFTPFTRYRALGAGRLEIVNGAR
jgi:hypothetical protein